METTHCGNIRILKAAEGMRLHRKDEELRPMKEMSVAITLLNSDSVADFEEVAESDLPLYSREEYEVRAAELVRRHYSEADEFAIQRKMLDLLINPEPSTLSDMGEPSAEPKALTDFRQYSATVESCKAEAKQALTKEAEARATGMQEVPESYKME